MQLTVQALKAAAAAGGIDCGAAKPLACLEGGTLAAFALAGDGLCRCCTALVLGGVAASGFAAGGAAVAAVGSATSFAAGAGGFAVPKVLLGGLGFWGGGLTFLAGRPIVPAVGLGMRTGGGLGFLGDGVTRVAVDLGGGLGVVAGRATMLAVVPLSERFRRVRGGGWAAPLRRPWLVHTALHAPSSTSRQPSCVTCAV